MYTQAIFKHIIYTLTIYKAYYFIFAYKYKMALSSILLLNKITFK